MQSWRIQTRRDVANEPHRPPTPLLELCMESLTSRQCDCIIVAMVLEANCPKLEEHRSNDYAWKAYPNMQSQRRNCNYNEVGEAAGRGYDCPTTVKAASIRRIAENPAVRGYLLLFKHCFGKLTSKSFL